jgi:hypothetical protein
MYSLHSQSRERRRRGVFSPFDGPAPRQKRPRTQPRGQQVTLPQLTLDLSPESVSHQTHHDSQRVMR